MKSVWGVFGSRNCDWRMWDKQVAVLISNESFVDILSFISKYQIGHYIHKTGIHGISETWNRIYKLPAFRWYGKGPGLSPTAFQPLEPQRGGVLSEKYTLD